MDIVRAVTADAGALLELQRLSYRTEAERYQDYTIEPMMQTLEDLRDELERKAALKALMGGKIIGSVRAYQDGDTCRIGKLFVHPDYRKRGVATALMNEIERMFAGCERYELFTGDKSLGNLRLYASLGYEPFRSEAVADHLNMIYLQKKTAANRSL